jgi:hypothetical protein
MPAGIYEVSGGMYTLHTACPLGKVLNDRSISMVVPLASCAAGVHVDPQGWPVSPGVTTPAQKWHLSEADLLNIAAGVTGLGSLSPATHRWVTNITPDRSSPSPNTVFLAEIKEVWGYRYLGWTAAGCWTPIMLKLKVLWLDYPLPMSGRLPGKFNVPPKPGRSFFEFFYITREGRLNTGPYSQPVLFPDALEYFLSEMRKSLLAPPKECGEGRDICAVSALALGKGNRSVE